MENERLLTAGEFAKIVGVTKHTLFHYEDIGLFCPIKRSEKDYRYYSIAQLDIFDIIYTLKDLDMPLEEIRTYIENRSSNTFLDLLDREQKIIEEKQKKLNRTKKWIEKKRKLIQMSAQIDMKSIAVVECPVTYSLVIPMVYIDETNWAMETAKLIASCERLGVKGVYGIGYSQQVENIWKKDYNNYQSSYVVTDQRIKSALCEERPAGTYLQAYHKGRWQDIPETYERFLEYAGQNCLELFGECYEDYMLDGVTQKSEEEYVTRILCRCSRQL